MLLFQPLVQLLGTNIKVFSIDKIERENLLLSLIRDVLQVNFMGALVKMDTGVLGANSLIFSLARIYRLVLFGPILLNVLILFKILVLLGLLPFIG